MADEVFLCEGWLGGLKAAMLARGENPEKYDELVRANQGLSEARQPVFGKVEENGHVTELAFKVPRNTTLVKRCESAYASRWSRRDKLSKRKQLNYLSGRYWDLKCLARAMAREVTRESPPKVSDVAKCITKLLVRPGRRITPREKV